MHSIRPWRRAAVARLRQIGACASILSVVILAPNRVQAQTLHDFVEAASARNPNLATLQARRPIFEAKRSAAETWTPGTPTLGGRYITDQVVRNRNAREAEIGISTPLWLPGEGTASRRVAAAELARSTIQGNSFKLKVAAQVRDALGEFALAEAEMRVAEQRVKDARSLESDVARRVQARDAAETDLLLARGDRLGAESELAEKRLTRDQGRIEFMSLTGLTPVSAALNEPSGPTHTGGDHPRLNDARTAIDVAQANQSLAAIQVRDSPEIGFVARRNRDIDGTVFDTSVGIEIRIPFATEARNAPRQAAAQAEHTEAAIAFETARREVDTEQQKAQAAYDTARVQRELNRRRASTLKQQSGLIAVSYRQGQVSLLDTIRARTLAAEADAALARAEIGIVRASGRLNTAFGLIP
jgi:cobalt-zinc-cadmium efflux system outer membrane protein